MIEVRGLTKRYRQTVAVDDLTVTIRPGVVTGFLGPNGAGKTTTMRVALGLAAPTAIDRHGGLRRLAARRRVLRSHAERRLTLVFTE